ncbi:MAG: hypothetical protein M9953_02915 [Thermomicrobiales bacterium]|nr:hypothetical protein [Thermomicrobiales bacterium]MCO5224267.1 hypothetical protein [Thermomicrobiales bacterium]MCO5227140.1 hypothetical protein [Thermomicrobiales bacterium]
MNARFPKIEATLIQQLTENFEIVDFSIREQEDNAGEFFMGGLANWGLVGQGIGAERDVEDSIIADSLRDVALDDGRVDVSLIHAEAGSGKTTLLRRVAASLSLEWDQVVLALKPFGEIDLLSVERLAGVTGRRVFVIVDDAANYSREITEVAKAANRAKSRVTLLLAERTNEWREATYDFDVLVDREYELAPLSYKEIGRILDELEKHDALGMLSGWDRADQVAAFTQRADKQLLVALKEATAGKRFDDIITDEYENIPTSEGQRAYLLVASLHRFGIYTRAGLLHRCLDIPISRLGDLVLEPTEKIIVSRTPLNGEDAYYATRHPLIAEILVDRKLVSDRRRLDFYSDIIQHLDLGYSSDADAFRRLTRTNNRKILRDFESSSDRRDLMKQMITRSPEDPITLQHAAMMELDQNDLGAAASYLDGALRLAPQNAAILDTKGRWYIRMAQQTSNVLLKEEYLGFAEQIFRRNIQRTPTEPYGYLHLSEVYLAWSKLEQYSTEELRYVSLAHQALNEGLSSSPMSSMLLQKQAELVQTFDKDNDKARLIFQKLLEGRPGDTASRLLATRLELRERRYKEALDILVDGLAHDGTNPTLHYEIAHLMATDGSYSFERVKGHFEAALLGSIREIKPRLSYGAYLFSQGRYSESTKVFDEISAADLGKRRLRNTMSFEYGGLSGKLTGKVISLSHASGRIDYDHGATSIFFSMRDVKTKVNIDVQRDSMVIFELRFNDRGPIAVAVETSSHTRDIETQIPLLLPGTI